MKDKTLYKCAELLLAVSFHFFAGDNNAPWTEIEPWFGSKFTEEEQKEILVDYNEWNGIGSTKEEFTPDMFALFISEALSDRNVDCTGCVRCTKTCP